MLSRRLALAAGTATLLLAACQSTPPRPAPRPIDFSNFGPIVLNAGTIDVVDAYRPVGGKHVEGRSAVPPAEAVRRWAAERLQAGGGAGGGRVRVTIRDASIVEVQLPTKTGITGYFTNDQAQRYDGRIEVEITGEVPDSGNGGFRGVTRATVTHSMSVAENISLADREATFLDITRRMMEDLNARLDAGIRKDLAPMVRR